MAVSVRGTAEAGLVHSSGGKVRLLKRNELDQEWDPVADERLTIWEVTQHLIRRLDSDGEQGAANLLRRIGFSLGEVARELAYRMYQTCERKKLAQEAQGYNALVVSWPEISKLSRQAPKAQQQTELFE